MLDSSDRSFGRVFAAFFFILFCRQAYKGHYNIAAGLLAASIVFLLISIFSPKMLGPLNRVWMKFGDLLHKIVSPIILAIMYFVVITPFGILMRTFGKDPVHKKWSKEETTYWVTRENKGPAPESMKYQF